MELIHELVQLGADVTATYRLPDGRSTGITALHAVLLYSDPTDYIKKYFQPSEVEQLQQMSEYFAERLEEYDETGAAAQRARDAAERMAAEASSGRRRPPV